MKLSKKQRRVLNISKGISLLLISLIAVIVIGHDFISLIFKGGCFTWFGLFTHIIAWMVLGLIWGEED